MNGKYLLGSTRTHFIGLLAFMYLPLLLHCLYEFFIEWTFIRGAF